MVIERQNKDGAVTLSQARQAIGRFFAQKDYGGKRILLIIPDNTRSGPIGDIFKIIYECLQRKAKALDCLVALGTHQPLSEEQICARLAITMAERHSKYAGVKFFNHEWNKPETFTTIGKIHADEVEKITGGFFREEVSVAVNKLIFDYDEIVILGPVFPHEVVGFSGGHKYIFPGIAGAEIIDFFHWLGAVITNPVINGNKWTPTRHVVEKAASFIKVPRQLFAVVAVENKLKGIFIGDCFEAWEKAADLSQQVHIIYKDKPYKTILGIAPKMYDDLWTAAKAMYKLEPIAADGATLIIYAPHITEISYTHGKFIDRIGYHTRDYFLGRLDKFAGIPRAVIAHSTHVKGIGTYINGVEKPRINVVLATGISQQRCEKVNLGYMNPDSIDISDYENREDDGILVVRHAGEVLHRLSSGDMQNRKEHSRMAKADIGLIGLAVMGENLILNMESKGFTVACYNRTVSKVDDFINGRAKGKNVIGCKSIKEFVASLKKPRKIMLMVKAGQPVDDFIEQLLPHLEDGDIIIDGGNSHYPDTIRRTKYVESKGKLYIGTGVSGGEEGALRGPSIMPGGSPPAWEHIKPIFQKIAAKAPDGLPCCEWMGENGAGHFVKMVHNGIEYGDMQLICEAYQMMKQGLGMTNQEMHQVFSQWNQGELNSYLIEITRDILAHKDEAGNEVIDLILDTAGQKGTGKWTVVEALDAGQPLTLIGEAVFARCLSAIKEQRVTASKILRGPKTQFRGDKAKFIDDLRAALYASKIVSYAQGYQLMRAAAQEHKWNLNYGGIASIWRGGCIIRSAFLSKIKEAFGKKPDLENLLLDPFFKRAVEKGQTSWRRVVNTAVKLGIAIPTMSSALSFYDGYRAERLPANLLQAQRDYFGAHTYERVDKPRGEFFHTNWTGRGGETASTAYNV